MCLYEELSQVNHVVLLLCGIYNATMLPRLPSFAPPLRHHVHRFWMLYLRKESLITGARSVPLLLSLFLFTRFLVLRFPCRFQV